MLHEGYADPVTNDGPGFHSDMPVSELTERDTRAIKASDVSSTPPVAETIDRATITKMSRPSTGPPLRTGDQGKLDSQGDRMRGRRTLARILGRGYETKTTNNVSKTKKQFLLPVSLSSSRSLVTPNSINSKGLGLT